MRRPRVIAGSYTTMGWARPRWAWGAFVLAMAPLRGAHRPVSPARQLRLAREALRLQRRIRRLTRELAALVRAHGRESARLTARLDQLEAEVRDRRAELDAGEEWKR